MPESDELLDILDASGHPTGERKPRSLVHRDGDWHRVFHLWVVGEGSSVLLQRRSAQKDLEPGKVDVTVGGHLRAGETLADAVREAEEEIGLIVASQALTPLGTWKVTRAYDGAVDREHQEAYLVRSDWPLERYSLDCREVYQLYELPIAKAVALYHAGEPVAAAGIDCYGRPNDSLLVEPDLIAGARETVVEQLEAIARLLAAR